MSNNNNSYDFESIVQEIRTLKALDHSDNSRSENVGVRRLVTLIAHFGTEHQASVAFARFVFANNRLARISDAYVVGLSERHETFDAIVVCGNDHTRLRKFLRLYRPILHRKIKIAVMPQSTPRERSALLNGGFDDVFDEKFDPMEVQLRIAAIYRRVRVYNAHRTVTTLISAEDRRRYFVEEPTPREAYLFNLMINQLGQSIPIHRLRAPPSKKYEQVSIKSLLVYLAGLRKKLSRELLLRNDGQAGYSIHLPEEAGVPTESAPSPNCCVEAV